MALSAAGRENRRGRGRRKQGRERVRKQKQEGGNIGWWAAGSPVSC
jgi:hypothetical protein